MKHGRAAGIAGAVGAALPDIPSILGTAYYIGPRFLTDGWSSMDSEEVLEAIYFTGPFGATGYALHAATGPLVFLTAYALLRLKRRDGSRDGKKIILWFLVGWLGHTLVDFLTHAEDVRPLFYPLSDWTWASPISYYDPDYHGRAFALASNGFATVLLIGLLLKRLLTNEPDEQQ
ncbi:MAG: hypothetical protein ACR2KW_07120 [Rubrobacter sp.]